MIATAPVVRRDPFLRTPLAFAPVAALPAVLHRMAGRVRHNLDVDPVRADEMIADVIDTLARRGEWELMTPWHELATFAPGSTPEEVRATVESIRDDLAPDAEAARAAWRPTKRRRWTPPPSGLMERPNLTPEQWAERKMQAALRRIAYKQRREEARAAIPFGQQIPWELCLP